MNAIRKYLKITQSFYHANSQCFQVHDLESMKQTKKHIIHIKLIKMVRSILLNPLIIFLVVVALNLALYPEVKADNLEEFNALISKIFDESKPQDSIDETLSNLKEAQRLGKRLNLIESIIADQNKTNVDEILKLEDECSVHDFKDNMKTIEKFKNRKGLIEYMSIKSENYYDKCEYKIRQDLRRINFKAKFEFIWDEFKPLININNNDTRKFVIDESFRENLISQAYQKMSENSRCYLYKIDDESWNYYDRQTRKFMDNHMGQICGGLYDTFSINLLEEYLKVNEGSEVVVYDLVYFKEAITRTFVCKYLRKVGKDNLYYEYTSRNYKTSDIFDLIFKMNDPQGSSSNLEAADTHALIGIVANSSGHSEQLDDKTGFESRKRAAQLYRINIEEPNCDRSAIKQLVKIYKEIYNQTLKEYYTEYVPLYAKKCLDIIGDELREEKGKHKRKLFPITEYISNLRFKDLIENPYISSNTALDVAIEYFVIQNIKVTAPKPTVDELQLIKTHIDLLNEICQNTASITLPFAKRIKEITFYLPKEFIPNIGQLLYSDYTLILAGKICDTIRDYGLTPMGVSKRLNPKVNH